MSKNGSTNGSARHQHDKVRVAIIGVGNCASSFVQGVHYYKDADPDAQVPGLMHVDLGGYHVRDIEFTAAFDIDADKVGKDLSQAIFAGQNNTLKFDTEVPNLSVEVMRGMTHDGLGKYLSQKITKAPGPTVDIVQVLKDTRTDVVVSYLPVGSEQATKWYVEQILEAGCGFVNCIPVFIAREDYWNNRFKKAGLPIVGDDIKSQVGATIVHRQLARLFHDRGVKLLRTSQLNVGGNMDFFNMLERERLESKKISKTNAVTSVMGHELPADDVHVGPSDYVPWLTDRKWAHIRLEGQAFGDVPLTAELKLEVWDSPNSAGIVTDAVRCCKLALNHGLAGQLDGPSSYLMKSPMHQRPDDEAHQLTQAFIEQYSRKDLSKGAAPVPPGRGQRRLAEQTAVPSGARVCAPDPDPNRLILVPAAQRLAIAQVTPFAWEVPGEVNHYVARVSDELADRGHRVLIVAPSESPELVRDYPPRAARPARTSCSTKPTAEPVVLGRRRGAALLPRPAARRFAAGRRRAHDRVGADRSPARRGQRPRAVRAQRLERGPPSFPGAQRGQLPCPHRAAALHPAHPPAVAPAVLASRRSHGQLPGHSQAPAGLLPRRLPGDRARR